jgi:signal transduction histidine kinase
MLAVAFNNYLTPLRGSLVFQKTQYKLLFSYSAIFALILVIFAVGVRIAFFWGLDVSFRRSLTFLARSASSDMEFIKGDLVVKGDFSSEELIANHQALQWFDLQGNLVETRGRDVLKLPFSTHKLMEVETDDRRFQGTTWPVVSIKSDQRIGYVRASQSPEDFDKTLRDLNWILGGSIVLALVVSGIGGIWLTGQAMQPIEESFQRLKQFTADASHELRGPLMAIKSNVAVALKYPEGMRGSDAEKFKAISSATSQMTNLTEDLLLLARTQQAPSEERKRVDLEVLLESLVQLYTPQAQEKQITLKTTHLTSNLYVLGDPVRLSRLFSNLIENAIQYTLEGGKVEIQTRKDGYYLQVNVRDAGIGIAPEYLKHVFDRFWRDDASRSYRTGGSGLGLAIAQAIVQSHGGLITVTSKVGVGSCFTVRLRACVRF